MIITLLWPSGESLSDGWFFVVATNDMQPVHVCFWISQHKSVLYLCVLVQHWACVWSRSPAPQPAHHPPSSLRCVSVRPQQSPSRRGFTTEMAAKVCRSVLLLSRSSGAGAGSLPALVVSSQRHHQHIRPVSPRTSVRAGRGVGPGRQAGPERESGGGGWAG